MIRKFNTSRYMSNDTSSDKLKMLHVNIFRPVAEKKSKNIYILRTHLCNASRVVIEILWQKDTGITEMQRQKMAEMVQ